MKENAVGERDHHCKRGSLAYSTLLITSALLLLAASIALYTTSLKSVSSASSNLGSMASQQDSAAWAFASLARQQAANITVASGNIIIISNSSGISNYTQDALALKQFWEGYSAPGNLTINASTASKPVFYIYPQNITLDYSTGGISITPQNASYSAGNVTGYDFGVKISTPTPSLVWTNISTVANTSADALYFHIGIQGTNGTVSDTQYLNRSKTSALVMRDSLNNTLLAASVTPQAAVRLSYFTQIWSRAVVFLNGTYANSTRVGLGANFINVRLVDGSSGNSTAYVDG